jgi:hypothetical protein
MSRAPEIERIADYPSGFGFGAEKLAVYLSTSFGGETGDAFF